MPIRSSILLAAALTTPVGFGPLFVVPARAQSQAAPIKITADLSEAPRRLYHAEIDIPVKPGPLSLITPKWIPGNHRPTGPVDEITGVVFTANGQTLKWRRDDIDLYEFHLVVPKGVTSIHAHLDCIVTARVSDHMAVLEWEKLLLYPANIPGKDIPVQPNVTVAKGWGIGTALQPTGTTTPPPTTGVDEQDHQPTPGATTTEYAVTTVEQLEDSPLITGEYFHEFPLAPEMTPKHYIDVVSDEPEDSNLRPELLTEISNLVREANAAYGSHHYNVYHFLLTLSDVAGGEGLEHGQSSDNGGGEKAFANPHVGSDLLAHEYTHSWNGKYRRPARLYQPTFDTVEQGNLLWVYEGMTQYMGNVLAARSGLKSKQQYLDTIATTAASLDYKSGRDWRSTEDTAIAASILRGGDPAWSNWRRGQDYYQEGLLVWMDVDTKIRQLTDGKKSLTDFQRIFLAKGGNAGPMIVPYEFPELVADLNEVVPYDWGKLLREKVDDINPRADTAGITQGGYELIYLEHPPVSEHGAETPTSGIGGPSVWYSLGLRIGGGRGRPGAPSEAAGTISDVRYGGPSDAARLYPGQRIIAVNGKVYSPDVLLAAVTVAKGTTEPIHLVVGHEGAVIDVDLNYHDGNKYPVLKRVDGTPDYLDDIAAPLITPEHTGHAYREVKPEG
jgi:predicted metalloprotease with PDZ domain